jgi:hypothetical protein
MGSEVALDRHRRRVCTTGAAHPYRPALARNSRRQVGRGRLRPDARRRRRLTSGHRLPDVAAVWPGTNGPRRRRPGSRGRAQAISPGNRLRRRERRRRRRLQGRRDDRRSGGPHELGCRRHRRRRRQGRHSGCSGGLRLHRGDRGGRRLHDMLCEHGRARSLDDGLRRLDGCRNGRDRIHGIRRDGIDGPAGVGHGNRTDRRLRLGNERRRRRGEWGRERGQQAERVEVAVGIGGDPDAEMDVRSGRDRIHALADDTDDRPLLDDAAAKHARRAELEQGHGIAVGRLDRDRAAAAGDRADERDRPRGRREHAAADLTCNVDAAVLSARVRVRPERERSQHRARGRPDPGRRRRSGDERREQDEDRENSPHR